MGSADNFPIIYIEPFCHFDRREKSFFLPTALLFRPTPCYLERSEKSCSFHGSQGLFHKPLNLGLALYYINFVKLGIKEKLEIVLGWFVVKILGGKIRKLTNKLKEKEHMSAPFPLCEPNLEVQDQHLIL